MPVSRVERHRLVYQQRAKPRMCPKITVSKSLEPGGYEIALGAARSERIGWVDGYLRR